MCSNNTKEGKKGGRQQHQIGDKQKTNSKMVDLNLVISVITLNGNRSADSKGRDCWMVLKKDRHFKYEFIDKLKQMEKLL